MGVASPGRIVYSVEEIVDLLSRELSDAFPDLWVEGEVASLKRAASGHVYFSLKGQGATLRTVLFRSYAARLSFLPENGARVLARGKISLYKAGGDLQLYATFLEPAGLGALQAALEASRKRLMEEGLTDPTRRRPIPPFPRRIGVVTSLEAAALQDVLTVLRRRRAGFDVVIAPSPVQGENAPTKLRDALERLAATDAVEVILLTRGGGDLMDLWAFNDEALARAVASCPVPVISAVGHEVDTVLTDLTADLRAPTPSAAAELLTARCETAAQACRDHRGRLIRSATRTLERLAGSRERGSPRRVGRFIATRIFHLQQGVDRARDALDREGTSRIADLAARACRCSRAFSPRTLLHATRALSYRRDDLSHRLQGALGDRLGRARSRLTAAERILGSLSPRKVLDRGYAVVFAPNGRLVRSPGEVPSGCLVTAVVQHGALSLKQTDREPGPVHPALAPSVDGDSRDT